MYDLPKAAHFDAFHEGQLLPHAGPAGGRVRWLAANSVSDELGIRNMIGLTDQDKRRIDEHLSSMFAGLSYSVRRTT